jgi:ubiquinone/menaquinone biosynthesis C-methylase UbiE
MTTSGSTHVCPWWLGYVLLSPLRRLRQNPKRILAPHVREGMTVLEIGPGMGFFSLELARLVGSSGRVVCVDVQEKMLQSLMKRAERNGVQDRIIVVTAAEDSLRLGPFEGAVDFVFVFAVAHEVPDQFRLFAECARAMKTGACMLLSEPKGHVRAADFEQTLLHARANGFVQEKNTTVFGSHTALLRKE